MGMLVTVSLNALFLIPLFLLPIGVSWFCKGRYLTPIVVGGISGVAIAIYLNVSGYLLFTKVFVSDLLFQANLLVGAFLYSLLQRAIGSVLPQPSPPHVTNLALAHFGLLLILYALAGAVVGFAVGLARK